MGRLSDAARETAENIERIVSALESMPQGGSFAGPAGGGAGGGAGAGGSAIPQTVFNTTVVVPNRTTNTPIGTRGDDIQSRAFAYYGLSSMGKSDAFIKQIIAAFQKMIESQGMSLRMGGG